MALINDPDGLSQGGITTPGDIAVTGASGTTATLTGSATLPAVTAGDYIELRGMVNAENNGLFLVTGSPTTSSIAVTKQALTGAVVNPSNETANATARVFGTNADEKNVYFDPANRRYSFLNGFGSVTVLDNSGVLWQSWYSFCKEEWKTDNDLIKFTFPLIAITPEQFEHQDDWKPTDEAESTIATGDPSDTRKLLRTGGWDEVDADGFLENQYIGVITLGNIDASDFAYYSFAGQTAATNYTFDGPVNESVQTVQRVDLTGFGTIAFSDSNTITNTTGDWTTYFNVGDRVYLQNAEDVGNAGSFLVTAVSASNLDVSGTPFTTNADDTTVLIAVDRRQTVMTNRIRVFGKTFDSSSSTAIGVTAFTNQVYRFPLSESSDPVVQDYADANNGGSLSSLYTDVITTPIAPFNDMTIAYFATAQDRSNFNPVGGDSPSPGDTQFGVIVDADVSVGTEDGGGSASAEEIYIWVAARISGSADINDGSGAAAVTVPGQLAERLLTLASTGNTMTSRLQTTNPGGDGNGVYVDTFSSADKNRVQFLDNDGDTRTFPFVATGSILFNANLSTDVDAVYRMFFTNDDAGDNTGRDFDTINAITVNNAAASPIAGSVPQMLGGSSLAFDYDYDGNVQRGAGSVSTPVPITLVAIGLSTGQYVIATGTITAAEGQTFSLVAALERNFNNP
jgi:hypothetical protein